MLACGMLAICCQLPLALSFSLTSSTTSTGSWTNDPTPANNAALPMRSESRPVASEGESSDDKFNLPALVVNLDNRVDRWQTIRRQLKGFGIDTVRISAVSASSLRKSAADEYSNEEVVRWKYNTTWNAQFDWRIAPNQVLTLSDSEYATCLSHIKAWKYIVDEKLPAALILEDDAVLGSNFKSVVSPALKEVPTNWDILYAGYLFSGMHTDRAKVSTHIYSMIDGVFGMHGYLVTQAGAQKLLALLPVVQPLDNFVAKLALDKQIEAYLVEPKVVWQDMFGGSDVYHSGPISGGVVYENKAFDRFRKSIGNGISIGRAWLLQHLRITLLLLFVVVFAGFTCSSRGWCLSWSRRGESILFRSKKGFSLV